MKKIYALLLIAFIVVSTINTYAQTFKYQAIIRDNNGSILTNKNVGLRVSILQGTTPTVVYKEEYNKTSDQFGIINLEIGTGSVLSGNFLTIDWSKTNNQLQLDIDLNGGTTYTLLGTSPILSVPVANYATKAGGATFPAGLIMPFGGAVDKIPSGWLLCDGSEISRTQYVDLFNTISVNWGAGNLTTTFNLPDLRGQFLRGMDGTANVDPDKTGRTAKYSGGSIGNNVGSFQSNEIISHSHTVSGTFWSRSGNGQYDWTASSSSINKYDTPVNINNFGGSETRPNNVYVNYIIKY
ncbi:MAG: tail fiber protein [Bacteroidales bacterium]|nr:tail fiber protein [Bacteroidales bacterium]